MDGIKKFLPPIAGLTALWILVHAFLFSWGLPGFAEPTADGIPADPAFSAKEMMQADTGKYGPLQYLIVGTLFPEQAVENASLEIVTARIIRFRCVTAVMSLGIAVLVFLAGLWIAGLPRLYAFGAGAFTLLAPLSVFYSSTTNMDIPCTFHFTAAMFFAFLAEKYKGKRLLLFHALAGFFLACAFCTKDQVYALCFLPALVFAIWKYRTAETNKWCSVITPFALWTAVFLPTVALIYLWIGGWQIFVEHFQWITGSGQQGYQQVANGITGRLLLFGKAVLQWLCMLDLPLLVGVTACVVLLTGKKKWDCFNGAEKSVAVCLGLLFLSFHLFFTQPVRFTHTRYMLLLLPFSALTVAILIRHGGKRVAPLLLAGVLLLQCGNAFFLIRAMRNQPLTMLRNDYAGNPQLRQCKTATLTATHGALYRISSTPGNPREEVKTIRHWHYSLILPDAVQTDIYPSESGLLLAAPDLVLLTGQQYNDRITDLLRRTAYEEIAVYTPVKTSPLSLFDELQTDPLYLYRKTELPATIQFHLFAGETFHWQLAILTDAMQTQPQITDAFTHAIGNTLKPFEPFQPASWNISPDTMLFTLIAYHRAGRTEDTEKMKSFILQNLPEAKPVLLQLGLLPPDDQVR